MCSQPIKGHVRKFLWTGIGFKMICYHDDDQMETFSAILGLCAGNSPVTGEFPAQRPVTRTFDVFFELCLNKRLSKPLWGWWFEMPSCPLWRHCKFINACTWIYQPIGDVDATMSRGVGGIGIQFHDEIRASCYVLTTRGSLPVQRIPIRGIRAWKRAYNRTNNVGK